MGLGTEGAAAGGVMSRRSVIFGCTGMAEWGARLGVTSFRSVLEGQTNAGLDRAADTVLFFAWLVSVLGNL